MDRDQAIRLMQDLLRRMVEKKGSDLFITAGFPPAIKIELFGPGVKAIMTANTTRPI